MSESQLRRRKLPAESLQSPFNLSRRSFLPLPLPTILRVVAAAPNGQTERVPCSFGGDGGRGYCSVMRRLTAGGVRGGDNGDTGQSCGNTRTARLRERTFIKFRLLLMFRQLRYQAACNKNSVNHFPAGQ